MSHKDLFIDEVFNFLLSQFATNVATTLELTPHFLRVAKIIIEQG